MIVESLRYWVTDYHIDGFRFDLAAILGRDQNGNPMSKPPLLESLAHDPILPYNKYAVGTPFCRLQQSH